MITTLTKHGDNYVLVIDKSHLELLQVSSETPLEIFPNGQSLVLVPIRNPNDKNEFQNALQKVHQRFGPSMKRLAE